jgi:hypothetical protein
MFSLQAFLYTFRNEDVYLAWNFAQDPYREYDLYLSLGVDGYFTDFPATFNRYLNVLFVCNVNDYCTSAWPSGKGVGPDSDMSGVRGQVVRVLDECERS